MELPEDLKLASDLLRQASGIVAKRLASDDGPVEPLAGSRLASAIDYAQRARAELRDSVDVARTAAAAGVSN